LKLLGEVEEEELLDDDDVAPLELDRVALTLEPARLVAETDLQKRS
jgi:hypothetical protein